MAKLSPEKIAFRDKAVGKLVDAVAIMAFMSGGVKLFGLHFISEGRTK